MGSQEEEFFMYSENSDTRILFCAERIQGLPVGEGRRSVGARNV
ncbi:hypothetical protein VDG1235_1064 [Verrucomicrobiia bacterium DG1235]|nr:hypothetical protein VDG1235_1064 [Verrucomicrobiae bacterium DG1235]